MTKNKIFFFLVSHTLTVLISLININGVLSFQSLPTEHARQAFISRDKDRSGSLPALEFVGLMKDIRGFKMSPYVQDNLLSVSGGECKRRRARVL